MKAPVRSVVIFILIYYLLALAAGAAYVFFLQGEPPVLPVYRTNYLIDSVIILFIAYLPALQISGLLVPYSWFFRDLQDRPKEKLLRGIFFVVITCMFVSIACMEFVQPYLRSRQQQMETASNDYYDLLRFGDATLAEGDFQKSSAAFEQALLIYPSSSEALRKRRELENRYIEFENASAKNPQPAAARDEQAGLTFPELAARARASFSAGSYIDAHYYATLALADKNSAAYNTQELRQIAADSWNRLSETGLSEKSPDNTLYARKKQGYIDILNENYLSAYYIFHDLFEKYRADPDVVHYFEVASQKLQSQFFFIDETYNLQPFEKIRNIHFAAARPDGITDIVSISGLTAMRDSGGLIQYARGLQIIRFDDDEPISSMYVDYAKIFAVETGAFGAEYDRLFDSDERVFDALPVIQLVSVDRNTQGILNSPVFDPPPASGDSVNSYVLYVPYEDFLLLSEVNKGPENMSLPLLIKFISRAERYGYSSEVYSQVLYRRLCFPLLLLALTMLAIIAAWKFRIKDTQTIKFRWLLYIPVVTVGVHLIVQVVLYYFSLFMYTLIGVFKSNALWAMLVALVLGFSLLSLFFAVQTDE